MYVIRKWILKVINRLAVFLDRLTQISRTLKLIQPLAGSRDLITSLAMDKSKSKRHTH